MTDNDWRAPHAHCLGVRYAVAEKDQSAIGADEAERHALLLLMNADRSDADFMLPAALPDQRWTLLLETTSYNPPPSRAFKAHKPFRLAAHSLALFTGEP
jgi:hypothetical protein